MLKSVAIKNYKSIVDETIELGRLNVFIGENGCGKTNILEALALQSCAVMRRLNNEDLYNRGVRVARPRLMRSSFRGEPVVNSFEIAANWTFEGLGAFSDELSYPIHERAGGLVAPARRFLVTSDLDVTRDNAERLANVTGVTSVEMVDEPPDSELRFLDVPYAYIERFFGDFVIYNLNILALRGLDVTSRRTPLGIHGEGLDTLIASFSDEDLEALSERARCISWLDRLELDRADARKFQGFKLGRSHSTLYFADRFMAADNNVFSAENANEGILHVLFYLALFLSKETPAIFGIDNVETALNPLLCRNLVKELAALAGERDKQALITTHNPAILDGLNLHDDEQRLFVVYRDDDGHTRCRRIRVKPDVGEPLKLSELWMRGHLGGLPQGF